MRLLLDTHALLWFLFGNKRLSGAATRAISNSRNRIFVSAVSGYELALKVADGEVDRVVLDGMSNVLQVSQFVELPVNMAHMLDAGGMSDKHKDPWDRILAAQARSESLVVVTADDAFNRLGARTLW